MHSFRIAIQWFLTKQCSDILYTKIRLYIFPIEGLRFLLLFFFFFFFFFCKIRTFGSLHMCSDNPAEWYLVPFLDFQRISYLKPWLDTELDCISSTIIFCSSLFWFNAYLMRFPFSQRNSFSEIIYIFARNHAPGQMKHCLVCRKNQRKSNTRKMH